MVVYGKELKVYGKELKMTRHGARRVYWNRLKMPSKIAKTKIHSIYVCGQILLGDVRALQVVCK